MAEIAARAEDAGWDGVFLEDYVIHWQPGVPTHDPWVTLAAMAIATRRIKLGTVVTPLPRRRPWIVGRQLATLDHLSAGRMVFGAGLANDTDPDIADFGEEINTKARAEMLDAGLEILAGMWSGEPFSIPDGSYKVPEVAYDPVPVQRPRIPIWIGGSSTREGPVRRAAAWDGMVPVPLTGTDGKPMHLAPDDVQCLYQRIAGLRADNVPFDLVIGGRQRNQDDEWEREHIAAVGEAGATWWLEWIPSGSVAEQLRAVEQGPLT